MKNALLAIATGTAAYFLTKKLRKESPSPKPAFEWISAEEELEAEPSEPMPMFYEGDELHLFEPHSGSLFTEEYSIGPALYTVEAVKYDEEDEVFRYKLAGFSDEWVSEDWLSLPFYTKFKKRMGVEALTVDLTEALAEHERKILGKAMDDFAKGAEIDRLLDVMNSDVSEGVRQAAKDRLRELTEK